MQKMADERQFDFSVVYGVCPQNRKHSYEPKILYYLTLFRPGFFYRLKVQDPPYDLRNH